jgi:hypothetical protein
MEIMNGSQLAKTSVLAICMVFLSCSDRNNRQALISKYAALTCEHVKLMTRKDSLVQLIISPLERAVWQLENDYNEMTSVYDNKITILNGKRYEADAQYTEDYVRISKKHEESHGHLMTPQYKKAIDELERIKASNFQILDKELSSVTHAKETDQSLKKKEEDINVLNAKVEAGKKSVNEIETKLREQESELADINKQLDKIIQELTGDNRTNLQKEKDSARIHPCNRK